MTAWSGTPDSGAADKGFTLTKAPGGGACAKTMAERPFAPGFTAEAEQRQGRRPSRPSSRTSPAPKASRSSKASTSPCRRGRPRSWPASPTARRTRSPPPPASAGAAERAKAQLPRQEPDRRRHDRSRHRPHAAEDRRQGLPRRSLSRARRSRWWSSRPAVAGPSTSAPSSSARRSSSTRKRRRSAPRPTRSPTSSAAPSSTSARSSVNVNRNEFTLNGTNCSKFATAGALIGGGADPTNPAAFSSFKVSAPVQLERLQDAEIPPEAEAAPLRRDPARQAPETAARSSRRGPATPTSPAPRSACRTRSSSTRPASAPSAPGPSSPPTNARRNRVYGKARAFTPLLGTPLEGPVYLRSSNNTLPDMVAHLEGSGRHRPGRPHRQLQGRHPHHLRPRPRRAGHQVRPHPAGRQARPPGRLDATSAKARVKAIVRLKGQNGKKVNKQVETEYALRQEIEAAKKRQHRN